MPEPNFQDRVKHKTSATNTTGIVIAKYRGKKAALRDRSNLYPERMYFDIRSDDGDRIYYATPAENWETISTEEERFE